MERRKSHRPIGEDMEISALVAATACAFFDNCPPKNDYAQTALREFIELILYCNKNKLYAVRDRALKKILSYLSEH